MKIWATLFGLWGALWHPLAVAEGMAHPFQHELMYHIFLRSFHDGNGDGVGDFRGLMQKLDYLQSLGVTTIWLNPIQSSPFYHNYFADDFYAPDPAFGTIEDFRQLMQAVHRRGMKLLIDMETQYVVSGHPWYKDAVGKPDSRYGRYLLYRDRQNQEPEPVIQNMSEIIGFDGKRDRVATVDLSNPAMLAEQQKIYAFWADPDGDGDFSDGVDGFRVDHVMDDLDSKGRLTNLYASFWRPVVEHVKRINPQIRFLAEQADWGNAGQDILDHARMDLTFDLPLMFAFRSGSADEIWRTTQNLHNERQGRPTGVHVAENHDISRIASQYERSQGWVRVVAALTLLRPGIPCLYYGQELGMHGSRRSVMNDGSDIPVRAAMPWSRNHQAPGMAHWYRSVEPWLAVAQSDNGPEVSVEAQESDPGSPLNFYRTLVHLRNTYPAIAQGEMLPIKASSKQIFAAVFRDEQNVIAMALNLGPHRTVARIDWKKHAIRGAGRSLLSDREKGVKFSRPLVMEPFDVRVWLVN